MSIFLIPERIRIDVRLSLDGGLLELLQTVVDQASDRAAAAALSVAVKANTAALAAVIKPAAKE